MPKATSFGEFYTPVSAAPPLQYSVPATELGLVSTIPEGESVQSGIIAIDGWAKIAFGLTSSEAGEISIQRYLDDVGSVVQGAPVTLAFTAATPANLNILDGLPYASLEITVSNTGGAAATLTNVALLLIAA